MIAFGCQQEVDGVVLFIHGTIPVVILPADLDVRLIKMPALADCTDATFAFPFKKVSPAPEPA
jgi:hypothetical protein